MISTKTLESGVVCNKIFLYYQFIAIPLVRVTPPLNRESGLERIFGRVNVTIGP